MELWVHDMAEILVRDISHQMADIHLTRTGEFPWEEMPGEHAVVFGLIQGDYELHIQLLTERRLLVRLAANMMGGYPEEEDIREYALEYFNTICGRFISEIINMTHIRAQLLPVRYEMSSTSPILTPGEQISTIYCVSDQQEQLIFSWTSMPIQTMMGSGKNHE